MVDKDFVERVGIALVLAAQRAREIAIQTNTPLIVFENGKVIEKSPTS